MPGFASHTSVAVAPVRNAAIAGSVAGVPPVSVHSTVMLAGHTITGGVVSTTRTLIWSVSLSMPSDTVSVTTVVPLGNVAVGVALFGSLNVIPVALHV